MSALGIEFLRRGVGQGFQFKGLMLMNALGIES
jgi:hypothetical protein